LAGRDEFGVVYYLIPPGSLADSWAVEIKAAGDLEHLWAGFGPFAAEKKIPLRGLVRSLPDTHHALITIPLVAFGPGRLTDDDRLVFSLAVQPGSGSARGVINVENIDFVQSPSRLFVDGFEGDDPAINALGLATGTFSSGAAAVAVRRARGGDASIKSPTCSLLSYGGSIGTNLGVDGFSYAGWYTEVGGGDFREASEIAFDVRGVEGGESFHVYLSDGNVRRRVAVPGERIRRELWTRCRIPLVQFGEQGVDLGHIERVEIVFEWEPTSGAIYIDNLAFEETQETVLTRVRPPAADADPRQR